MNTKALSFAPPATFTKLVQKVKETTWMRRTCVTAIALAFATWFAGFIEACMYGP